MPLDVPGEDTNLIEVERHAVLVFGEQHEVLRNFLVAISDLVEDKRSHGALAFGVLCDLKRNIHIQHAPQHPACVSRLIANQPPILHRGRSLRFLSRGIGSGLASGHGFLCAGTLQQRQLRALVDLIQVFGIALRLQMNIALVVRQRGSLDGIVAALVRQLLKSIVGLLGHQVTLLQPSFGSGGGAHARETTVTSQDLHNFAVLNGSGLVKNGSHLVAQESLRSRNISDLARARRGGYIRKTG